MKDKLNAYFAVLLVTIAGAGATWIIVRVAYAGTLEASFNANQAEYIRLQQEILNQ